MIKANRIQTSNEISQTDRSTTRAYLRELLPAILAYTVALLTVVFSVDFDTAGWWKYPVAMVPAIPAVWGALAIARHLGRIDEMQRSIMVNGAAFGFALAMIASITIGFLSIGGLHTDKWGPWIIYAIGMLGWTVGASRSANRY